jgi:hypothetical protein
VRIKETTANRTRKITVTENGTGFNTSVAA